jgi:GTP cyclohydrolase I
LNEYLSGYRYNVYDVVGKDFSAPSDNELIRVKIPFSSMCIHHLLPFYGHVIIEYRPSDRILGLSKFSRVVNVLSRRLQIQERLTKEIYDVLDDVLRPRELKVKVRAKHLCCRDRGVRIGSVFETEVSSSGSGDDREGKA